MEIYNMSDEQIESHFIYDGKISYCSIFDEALSKTFEIIKEISESWNDMADKIEVLEYFLREYGYIDDKVAEVYDALIKKNTKK